MRAGPEFTALLSPAPLTHIHAVRGANSRASTGRPKLRFRSAVRKQSPNDTSHATRFLDKRWTEAAMSSPSLTDTPRLSPPGQDFLVLPKLEKHPTRCSKQH